MNKLSLVKAYFSFSKYKTVKLNRLEDQLQPVGTERRRKRFWRKLGAILGITLTGIIFVRHGVPLISTHVPTLIEGLPLEIQFAAIMLGLAPITIGLGWLLYLVLRNMAETRAMEVQVRQLQNVSKLIVYTYGSGAVGFCKAVEKLSDGHTVKEMFIFAHPPVSAVKKGFLKIKGAIVACAPVQFAMGSNRAAIAARRVEKDSFDRTHANVLKAVGANKTAIEFRLIHIGQGHTSITCASEWGETRTTAIVGASPAVYTIVVRDAVDTDNHEVDVSVLNKAKASVVRIEQDEFVGSGVVVNSQGLVLTCAHVLEGEGQPRIIFDDGESTTGDIILTDEEADIAAIQCSKSGPLNPINMGDSSSLVSGDWVFAIGYPGIDADEVAPNPNPGFITEVSEHRGHEIILTDNSVTHGYSGAPLITTNGELVGLVTSKYSDEDHNVTMSISGNEAFDVLNELTNLKFSMSGDN